MIFLVPVAGPLDVDATLARYRLWGEDPVNRLERGSFHRLLRYGSDLIPYELHFSGLPDEARLEVRVPGVSGDGVRAAVSDELERLLGLAFDLPAFYGFAQAEPVLRAVIGPLRGLRPTLTPDPLEMLVTSITAQQVNLSFAFACRARLVRRYGTAVSTASGELYAFPEAEALAAANIEDLRALKYSTRKAEYIRDLSRAVVDRHIDLGALASAPNEEAIARLTALRGLGRWTAEWFLARHAGRGDVCPAGDLAVRKAFEHHFGGGGRLEEAAVRRRAQDWGAHQNLAVHYLLAAMRREGSNAGAP